MNKLIKFSLTFILGLGIAFMSACSSGSNDGGTNTPAVSGVLVDPFIVGAILCEDADQSASCDVGEQLSTETDVNGNFYFANPLSAGSHIIMAQQGYHNNTPYTLELAGLVDSSGKVDVVSPLTTLQTKSLSASQIRALLENAGLTGLSDDDIFANPLEGGINTLTTDDKLTRLHATLATYGMLKILKGSNTLNELSSTELLNSSEVNLILTAMVTTIKESLSKAVLDDIQTQVSSYDSALFTAPSVSVNVVTQTAVTAIDALTQIAYDVCNQTDGSDTQKVTAALAEMNAKKTAITDKVQEIGMQYYARENKATFLAIPASYQASLPLAIQIGMQIADTQAIIISNDANISTQSSDLVNFIISALADTSSQAVSTSITECPSIYDPNSSDFDVNASDQPHFAAGLDCDRDGGRVAFVTPRNYKVAFKSLGLINSAGEKVYLINKDLNESVVFDLTSLKTLGDMSIPSGTYTAMFAQIYYYWFDMEMIRSGNYMQMRVYMSDDDFAQWGNGGHHQGDLTKTDANNTELGFFEPGSWSTLSTRRTEPSDYNQTTPLYAATPDINTSHERGAFGDTAFWDNEALNPDDIFTITQNIASFNVTKESKIQLTFNIKDNWFFEDFGDNGIYTGIYEEENSPDLNQTGGWSPLIELPTITKVY